MFAGGAVSCLLGGALMILYAECRQVPPPRPDARDDPVDRRRERPRRRHRARAPRPRRGEEAHDGTRRRDRRLERDGPHGQHRRRLPRERGGRGRRRARRGPQRGRAVACRFPTRRSTSFSRTSASTTSPTRAAGRTRATRSRASCRPGGVALVSDFIRTGDYARRSAAAGLVVTHTGPHVFDVFPPLRIVAAEKPAGLTQREELPRERAHEDAEDARGEPARRELAEPHDLLDGDRRRRRRPQNVRGLERGRAAPEHRRDRERPEHHEQEDRLDRGPSGGRRTRTAPRGEAWSSTDRKARERLEDVVAVEGVLRRRPDSDVPDRFLLRHGAPAGRSAVRRAARPRRGPSRRACRWAGPAGRRRRAARTTRRGGRRRRRGPAVGREPAPPMRGREEAGSGRSIRAIHSGSAEARLRTAPARCTRARAAPARGPGRHPASGATRRMYTWPVDARRGSRASPRPRGLRLVAVRRDDADRVALVPRREA